MYEPRMQEGGAALRMQDSQADGDPTQRRHGRALLGMPGLPGPGQPCVRRDSTTGLRVFAAARPDKVASRCSASRATPCPRLAPTPPEAVA